MLILSFKLCHLKIKNSIQYLSLSRSNTFPLILYFYKQKNNKIYKNRHILYIIWCKLHLNELYFIKCIIIQHYYWKKIDFKRKLQLNI